MAKKTMLVLVAAALVTVAAAAAATPEPGSWRLSGWARQSLVEQQTPGGATQPDPALWVVNPRLTECVWDADDHQSWTFNGDLAAGASASATTCLFADWDEKIAWAWTDDTGLAVTVTVGPTSVSGSRAACVLGPDYDREGVVNGYPVEGSNGGVAVPTTVTFTVANTGRRKVRRAVVRAYLGLEAGNPPPCELGPWAGLDPAWRVGAG